MRVQCAQKSAEYDEVEAEARACGMITSAPQQVIQ